MASNKRIETDNDHAMASNDAISLIKKYFSEELPNLELEEDHINPTGYWGIKYKSEISSIHLDSGRGYLEWQILIDNHEVVLKNYDENVANVKISSKANIEFILGLIKVVVSNY